MGCWAEPLEILSVGKEIPQITEWLQLAAENQTEYAALSGKKESFQWSVFIQVNRISLSASSEGNPIDYDNFI